MQIGWIDFAKDDRRKALSVLQALRAKGAIDELGIGVVRDAFANRFFPGTSTLHTRAKYLLIVPYVVHDALAKRWKKSDDDVLKDINRRERACAVALGEDSSQVGVIGRNALSRGSWVLRPPSDIYWSGIRTYQIFRSGAYGQMSLDEFVRAACRRQDSPVACVGKARSSGDDDYDDNDAEAEGVFPFFDIEEVYESDWQDRLHIDLTSREASYLRKHILSAIPTSLMAYALQHNIRLDGFACFRDLQRELGNKVSVDLAELMRLAAEFNHLASAAHVRYNWLLRKGEGPAASRWSEVRGNMPNIAKVDLVAVFDCLGLSKRETGAFAFLQKFQTALVKGDLGLVDRLIHAREDDLKGESRSKLRHPELIGESAWVGGDEFDYRMPDAARILNDIMDAPES